MSRSIGFRRSVLGRAGSASGADNDRRPGQRQACLRLVPATLLLVALPMLSQGALAEGDATESAPPEIERQQIEGRLGTIERKEEDRGRLPLPGSRLDPYEPAPAPSETRGARHRLDLERRTLEGRRDGIDRDLERLDRGPPPSSSGLLDRLRRN